MNFIKHTLAAIALVCAAFTASAQLPTATLKTLEGATIETADITNNGKPIVVSFFATWCKPCLRELKAINEVYADWQDETGMKLVAISIDDPRTVHKVKPLVDAEGWEYEVLLDTNSDLYRALGLSMVPHLLIIDGNGKIVESHSGYTDGSEEHIIEVIRNL